MWDKALLVQWWVGPSKETGCGQSKLVVYIVESLYHSETPAWNHVYLVDQTHSLHHWNANYKLCRKLHQCHMCDRLNISPVMCERSNFDVACCVWLFLECLDKTDFTSWPINWVFPAAHPPNLTPISNVLNWDSFQNTTERELEVCERVWTRRMSCIPVCIPLCIPATNSVCYE